MTRLDTEDYSLYYGIGRLLVKLSYWVACICLLIAVFYYAFMDQVDEEVVFNVSRNALQSPEGFMKFQLFKEITSFPVIACTQMASLAFLIFALIIATKLILRSKEVIGAILIVACAICYMVFLSGGYSGYSSYSSLSLTVIIMFILTGVYFLIRGTIVSNLGVVAIAMIIFGAEMLWPRHYQLSHATTQYSGIWMAIISYATLGFVLYAAKVLLCDKEEIEEGEYEEDEDDEDEEVVEAE